METLREQLEALAEQAPSQGEPPTVVWARGMRRHRWRQASASVVVTLTVLLVVAVGMLVDRTPGPPVAGDHVVPQLPSRVNVPGSWSDRAGPDGPVAAIGMGMRQRVDGLIGTRERLEFFGVSALTGQSFWFDLPGVDLSNRSLIGWFALSPDGRWIAWSRLARTGPGGSEAKEWPGTLVGWSVMDTSTRRVRDFDVPGSGWAEETYNDLLFSADSRHLLVSYEEPGAPEKRGHQFVAWDVSTGEPTVLEEPGRYWLPNIGSAPHGVVWSRGRAVFREEVGTGRTSRIELPLDVTQASWGPDDKAFAWISQGPGKQARSQLYVGRTRSTARPVPLGELPPGELLGWTDARHVVVGHWRTDCRIVDVVTGRVQRVDLQGAGEIMNAPLLANALWANGFRDPVQREGTRDPRLLWYPGLGLILLGLVAVGWVRRRRRV